MSTFAQLYLVAPLIFLSLYYWPTFGITITVITIFFIGPLLAIAPRLLTDYPTYIETTKFISFTSNAQAVTHSHMNPSLYITPLAVGLLVGYLINKNRNRVMNQKNQQYFSNNQDKIKVTSGGHNDTIIINIIRSIIWLFSASSVVAIFIYHNETFMVQNIIHPVESIVGWFAYYKLVWSLFLGYTTYLFTYNNSDSDCWIASKLMKPIARLSYCIYLLRGIVIFYRQTSARQTNEIFYYESVIL